MPKAAGMQLPLRIRNSPGALALGGRADFDNDSVRRAGLSIDELGDLSIDQAQTSKSISSGSEFEISRMTLPRSRLMRALRLCAPRMR